MPVRKETPPYDASLVLFFRLRTFSWLEGRANIAKDVRYLFVLSLKLLAAAVSQSFSVMGVADKGCVALFAGLLLVLWGIGAL